MSKRKTNKKLQCKERPERIYAMNEAQGLHLSAIDDGQIILVTGASGAGKTFVSTIRACEYLYENDIGQVVLTRPPVESSSKALGALPGELSDKLDPFMASMKGCIAQRFSKGWLDSQIHNGNIVCESLGHIQGKTFDNAIIIVDEAEHLSVKEAYIAMTRVGHHSKIILCGDNYQKFSRGENGLMDAVGRLRGIEGVYHINYTSDDIVRSGIVREVVKAYDQAA